MRFPWLRRRWKWVVAGAIATTLPAFTFLLLNRQRTSLIEDLAPTSVRAVPLSHPAVNSVLARFALRPVDLPHLFWRIDVPDAVQIEEGTKPAEVRRAVEAINRLGGVRTVQLAWMESAIDPEVLVPLRDLKSLARLELMSLARDDNVGEVLVQVAAIPNLCEVSLSGWGLKADSIRRLQGLRRLERLDLSSSRESLSGVSALNGLRELCLDGSSLEVEHFGPLLELPQLERLSVVDCTRQMETIDGSFERVVLPTFKAMPALKELRIGTRGGFPGERVARLRAAIPQVDVTVVDTRLDAGYRWKEW
jgi:hypothetical protein